MADRLANSVSIRQQLERTRWGLGRLILSSTLQLQLRPNQVHNATYRYPKALVLISILYSRADHRGTTTRNYADIVPTQWCRLQA